MICTPHRGSRLKLCACPHVIHACSERHSSTLSSPFHPTSSSSHSPSISCSPCCTSSTTLRAVLTLRTPPKRRWDLQTSPTSPQNRDVLSCVPVGWGLACQQRSHGTGDQDGAGVWGGCAGTRQRRKCYISLSFGGVFLAWDLKGILDKAPRAEMIIFCGELPNPHPTRHTTHRKDAGVERKKTRTHFLDITAGIGELFPKVKVEVLVETVVDAPKQLVTTISHHTGVWPWFLCRVAGLLNAATKVPLNVP